MSYRKRCTHSAAHDGMRQGVRRTVHGITEFRDPGTRTPMGRYVSFKTVHPTQQSKK
jgi:hypothetical protein